MADDELVCRNEKTKIINCLFGHKDESNGSVGSIVFFDAIPVQPVLLEAEVMTPHFSKYYNNDSPPADWLNPEPIQFLTVAPEQRFMFAVAPRNPDQYGAMDDVKMVMEWLENALEWYGAGAKTVVGYGRFLRDISAEKQLDVRRKEYRIKQEKLEKERKEREIEKQRQAVLLAMSPVRKEIEQDGYSASENIFMKAMTEKWLGRLDVADTISDECIEIANLLADWYQKYRLEQWNKPSGKNEKKVKKIKSFLGAK